MTSGLQIAAVALIALLAIGQPALAANRRLLANTETSSVELLQAYVSDLAKDVRGRLLQQTFGSAATRGSTGGGASARPMAASASSELRSTTPSSFGTTTTAGTRQPGQVSIDGTTSDATTSNTNNLRGVTNNNGVLGQQPAEGAVSADVVRPSTGTTGTRPAQSSLGAGTGNAGASNLNLEKMSSSDAAMSMRSEP